MKIELLEELCYRHKKKYFKTGKMLRDINLDF